MRAYSAPSESIVPIQNMEMRRRASAPTTMTARTWRSRRSNRSKRPWLSVCASEGPLEIAMEPDEAIYTPLVDFPQFAPDSKGSSRPHTVPKREDGLYREMTALARPQLVTSPV